MQFIVLFPMTYFVKHGIRNISFDEKAKSRELGLLKYFNVLPNSRIVYILLSPLLGLLLVCLKFVLFLIKVSY